MNSSPSIQLPRLPERGVLTDLCKEAGARERLEPATVEKDFFLTRLLWALGQAAGAACLLKGGTLLSKVDLGFRRISEDADVVLPGLPSARRRDNAVTMNRLRARLKALVPIVGLQMPDAHGYREDRDAHCTWMLPYASDFGNAQLLLEVSIRPVLRPARRVTLGQLLSDPLLGDYGDAFCFALGGDEARAEKVRAACTRDAIRDFFDLGQLLESGADMNSAAFVELVDRKLAELNHPPIARHTQVFSLTPERRRLLERAIDTDLRGVLRSEMAAFDLAGVLERFRGLWVRP